MKRPSFQFYPADWLRDISLRRCSRAARGDWMDILCLLHDSEEYGIWRFPLDELAGATGVSMESLEELVAKKVLKGAHDGHHEFVFRPRHAGKIGDPVVLVSSSGGPVWYSARFVRDEYIRARRGADSRFGPDDDTNPRGGSGGPRKPKQAPRHTPHRAPTGTPKPPFGDGSGDGPSSSSSSSSSNPTGSNSVPKGTGAADAPPPGPELNRTPKPPKTPAPLPPAPTGVVAKTATPEDIRKQRIWRAAKSFFEGQGMPQKQSGTYLGRVAGDYGFDVFAEAVERMVTERPAEAVSWFKATCQTIAGERRARAGSNKQVALEAGNDAAVDAWLAEKELPNAN